MLRKLLYALPLLAICSCNNEDLDIDNEFSVTDNVLEEKMIFVRLADNATVDAGMLTFAADAPEATVKWIVSDGFNLDTTQTVVTLAGGKGKLPIRWEKKLGAKTYGPTDRAFQAGVIVTADDDSQYFPLIWADEVDSVKIANQVLRSRAAGVTPRAGTLLIPDTVRMDAKSGANMIIRYDKNTSAIVMNYALYDNLNIDATDLPRIITPNSAQTFTAIQFKWTSAGPPSFAFQTKVYATDVDGNYTKTGVVIWEPNAFPSLILTPASTDDLPAAGGTNVGAYSLQTNQYKWTVTTPSSWLRISPSAGSGHSMIYFSADPNPSTLSRTAVVTVACYDSNDNKTIERTITLTQKASQSITLSVTPTLHNISYAGGTNVAVSTIVSNTKWVATSNVPWLVVTPGTGTGNSSVYFSAARNNSVQARTAIVTISADGLEPRTVTIVQQESPYMGPTTVKEQGWEETNKNFGSGANGEYEIEF